MGVNVNVDVCVAVGVAVDVKVGVIVDVGKGWKGVSVDVLIIVGTEKEPDPAIETSLACVVSVRNSLFVTAKRIMLTIPRSTIIDRKPISNSRKNDFWVIDRYSI